MAGASRSLPFGVAVLAVLVGLFAVLLLVFGVLVLLFLGVDVAADAAPIGFSGVLAGVLLIGFGGILLGVAVGLWRAELWALVLSILVLGILLLDYAIRGTLVSFGGAIVVLLLLYLIAVNRRFR